MENQDHSDDYFNFKLTEWNSRRKKIVRNRFGMTVTGEAVKFEGETASYEYNANNGKYTAQLTLEQFIRKGCLVDYKFTLRNDRKEKSIVCLSAELLHPTPIFCKIDPDGQLQNGVVELKPKSVYAMFVRFRLFESVIGAFEIPVAFNFYVEDTKQQFTIAREIMVVLSDESATTAAKEIKSPVTLKNWAETILIASNVEQMADLYPIPDEYEYICEQNSGKRKLTDFEGMTQEQIKEFEDIFETKELSTSNYEQYLHLLLWFDESAFSNMLTKYNMENTVISLNDNDTLQLQVPSLEEKRPSLIKGDKIHIKVHEDDTSDNVAFEGVITKIRNSSIEISHVNMDLLELIEDNAEMAFDVRFVLGRVPYERMHAGIEKCFNNGMLAALFPNPDIHERNRQLKYSITDSDLYNKTIASNVEQKIAVQNIVNRSSMEAPYIVFGPPGTGKTVTIIEAILQIKKHHDKSRILVCAPANDVCDMLALKLIPHCTTNQLIRVHSPNRETMIPEKLVRYSNYNIKDERFTRVPGRVLSKYRIVVTTLILSVRLKNNYSPNFVFIDEAAQAKEAEVSCAIGLMKLGNQLILAGDPKQLGPIIGSRFAEEYKLGLSLLERLMTTSHLYKSGDNRFITMLKRNFRAHPTVLKIPNHLFYCDELMAVNKFSTEDPIANIFIYPRIYPKIKVDEGQPVEFCAVYTQENREGQSPSFFNELEAEMTIKYVEALMSLNKTGVKVQEKHIGIVTPYKRQMYRIKQRLVHKNFTEIEVGTVELFQGREKRIIIINTVRAQGSLVLEDKKYNLGFVKDPKRFNVALTRAKSKLIVIGCPLVLHYDDNWLAYIEFCKSLNAYFGRDYEKRTPEVKQTILNALSKVKLT